MEQNRKNITVVLVLVVILFVFSFIFNGKVNLWRNFSPDLNEVKKENIQKLPIASGKQVYNIITDNPKSPQIVEVTFDPLDIKKGENQKILVVVKDFKNGAIKNSNYTKVTAKTDNVSEKINLKFIKGESTTTPEGKTELLTYWEGDWTLNDSYEGNYSFDIESKNIFGEESVNITVR